MDKIGQKTKVMHPVVHLIYYLTILFQFSFVKINVFENPISVQSQFLLHQCDYLQMYFLNTIGSATLKQCLRLSLLSSVSFCWGFLP